MRFPIFNFLERYSPLLFLLTFNGQNNWESLTLRTMYFLKHILNVLTETRLSDFSHYYFKQYQILLNNKIIFFLLLHIFEAENYHIKQSINSRASACLLWILLHLFLLSSKYFSELWTIISTRLLYCTLMTRLRNHLYPFLSRGPSTYSKVAYDFQ